VRSCGVRLVMSLSCDHDKPRPIRSSRRSLVVLRCPTLGARDRGANAGPVFGAPLDRAFHEMPYSFGRHYVAQALAHSDASFRVTRATDCLFDCEPVTREIGITHVSLDQGCVTERVRELAEDRLGERTVAISRTPG